MDIQVGVFLSSLGLRLAKNTAMRMSTESGNDAAGVGPFVPQPEGEMTVKCFMTNQDCILGREATKQADADQKKETLFVISPYDFPYDDIYKKIIEPAAKQAGIEAQRADQAFQLGFVMCQKICRLMQNADYVLADVTEDNPNVYYELGLAWGFGKRILIVRDTEDNSAQNFGKIFGEPENNNKVASYTELLEFKGDKNCGAKFRELLRSKSIGVQKAFAMDTMRRQEKYISEKRISFCFQEGLSETKHYLPVLTDVAEKVNTAKRWTVKEMAISEILFKDSPQMQFEEFCKSKVLVVDVTHYGGKASAAIYFILGLSHALGRQTVPIANLAKCGTPSPFDVQGLWQIHFKDLDALERSLKGILEEIDASYEKERENYPLTYIWDRVLKSPKLRLLTCARALDAKDDNRKGGRTNVDKWDYTSVGELSAFLARQYREAHIFIAAPEEKETEGLDSKDRKKELAERFAAKIREIPNSVIIIGSPDVSDYAEIMLAKAYGISPYHPIKCEHDNPLEQHRCWVCKLDKKCVAQRGYLYYKNTQSANPRNASCFFRIPPDEKECVVWYGKRYVSEHRECGDEDSEGLTFGVLTIMKDKPELFGGNEHESANKWIVLLSGFTGIGTYGLAKLLTTLECRSRPKDGEAEWRTLQKMLTDSQINIEEQGIQVLLRVKYTSGKGEMERDTRKLGKCTILDARALFTPAATPV